VIFVFFGLIASGKSTLAAAFAARHDYGYFNTDRVRKELAGLRPEKSDDSDYGEGIYTEEFTEKTYTAMLERAEKKLRCLPGVVLDGSYTDQRRRQEVREMARRNRVAAVFIYCRCSRQETKRRLRLRAVDPHAVSDGRWEIFLRQEEKFVFPREMKPGELVVMDTGDSVDNLLDRLERELAERALHEPLSR